MRICVREADFDPGAELAALETHESGALASFIGIVRAEGTLTALELEHYPGMTEAQLARIGAAAQERFGLTDLLIMHRTGRLEIGARIMMVAAAAPHRKAALMGVDYMMDYLKSRAPFWKRSHFEDGASAWVAARESDEAALQDWQKAPYNSEI